jgi:hypothetical protein
VSKLISERSDTPAFGFLRLMAASSELDPHSLAFSFVVQVLLGIS